MNILETIIEHKRKEVDEQKSLYPVKLLERSIYFNTRPVSLKKYLLLPDKSGIIAEFKRKSPSKGNINPYSSIEKTTIGYMQAGASALSVLTDAKFFGGSNKDLSEARNYNYCPILRKDFIIDEYQVIESKSVGADVILLIAAVLSKDEIKKLSTLASSLGMEVLLEIHDETEVKKIDFSIQHIGINNRNLKTFEVNVEQSVKIAEKLPKNVLKISESGISNPETVLKLKQHGFNGFLIGEHFMKESRPDKAAKKFIQQLNAMLIG